MSSCLLPCLILCLLLPVELKTTMNESDYNCSSDHFHRIEGSIAGVVDQSSRVGKEQKIAMEMAMQDIHQWSTCSKLVLHVRDSRGNSSRAAATAIGLITRDNVQAIIGSLTLQEAGLISQFDNLTTKDIPIISMTPFASHSAFLPPQPPSLIQLSNDISVHMQCIAALVGYFRWQRVTALYEHSNSFTLEAGLTTHLSDSLQAVGAVVQNHLAFPPVASLPNPRAFIQEELKNLKSKSNRVFVLIKSSLEFASIFFETARQMGMMSRGYVWIISDDIASLLDSVDPSVLYSMQGVIGFKTNILEAGDSFRKFKPRFRRNFALEYPQEEEYSSPSIFSLRAYDAVRIVANAMQNVAKKKSSKGLLLDYILSHHFEGLTGKINIDNGQLSESPTFQIINVIGRSYRELAFWSAEFGFMEDPIENVGINGSVYGYGDALGSIYWPGGEQTVPRGWSISDEVRPLRIGVPARGAFNHFVNVIYDQDRNQTYVTGFSVNVFEAAVKRLPYQLPYVFVPYYGSYDEMVQEVYNQNLDAAVGDTEIMADRYRYADFSLPYMESGLVMVVTVKVDAAKETFTFVKAFKLDMWILMAAMSIYTGFVVWLNEYVNDSPEFGGPIVQQIGSMLWFSVTILSFAQRESIKNNMSRFVLGTWIFVIVIVTACFTAVLTSMMTVPRLKPSVLDLQYLQNTNAGVGCNGNSFIVDYLMNVLHLKIENIKRISSIHDYPEAFRRGDIEAAFFVGPHAKVFLAEYCKGYTMAGPSYQLGGFGFVFPKGSPLASDISQAVLRVTEDGEVNQLEKDMLSFSSCSSSPTDETDEISLGHEPFSGLLTISGSISGAVFLVAIARIMEKHLHIYGRIQASLIERRAVKWASLLLTQCYNKFGFQFFKSSFGDNRFVPDDMQSNSGA